VHIDGRILIGVFLSLNMVFSIGIGNSAKYFSGNEIKVDEVGGECGTYGEGGGGINPYNIWLWEKTLKERDHLEDRSRWEVNIKMNLQEIAWEGSCEYVDEYSASMKCGEFLD
jgi:hypothetical protein